VGVMDRLTRRHDGTRRFSVVAAGSGTAPAGVAVMPFALRPAAVTALGLADRSAGATTEQLAVLRASQTGVLTAVMAAAPAAPDTDLPRASGYAVVDVVTSGMSPELDRVVELAVVRLDEDGAVVSEWSSLLRPSVVVRTPGAPDAPGAATDLVSLARTAGVTVEELSTAPTLADVAAEVVDALAGRVLVAHGAAADLAFLRAELGAAGVELPAVPVLCTLESSWRHLPALSRRRLADCCAAAGVALDGVPTALTDARAAAGLLQRYLARSGERGEAQTGLLARAAAAVWPDVELPPLSSAAPREGAQPSLAGQPGRLAVVLEALPLDGPALPLPAVAGHVELLAEALAAGPLDDAAARALALLADAANLTRAQVRAASRGVVLALAGAVGREPTAGAAEREELLTAARVLAVDVDDVLAALTAAAVATGAVPVVTDVTSGDVGAAGSPFATSGATRDLEAALARAGAAAARVPSPRSDRAGARAGAGAGAGVPETPVAPLDLTDAGARAAVRAWARQNGLEVSDRGKLSRSVVQAYEAAR